MFIGIPSVDDLPDALLKRWLVEVVALHQVPAQAYVLREAAAAQVAAEVPAAAALVPQVLRQAGLHLVSPAALRALESEILVLQVVGVSRLPGRTGCPNRTWKNTKRTVVLVGSSIRPVAERDRPTRVWTIEVSSKVSSIGSRESWVWSWEACGQDSTWT